MSAGGYSAGRTPAPPPWTPSGGARDTGPPRTPEEQRREAFTCWGMLSYVCFAIFVLFALASIAIVPSVSRPGRDGHMPFTLGGIAFGAHLLAVIALDTASWPAAALGVKIPRVRRARIAGWVLWSVAVALAVVFVVLTIQNTEALGGLGSKQDNFTGCRAKPGFMCGRSEPPRTVEGKKLPTVYRNCHTFWCDTGRMVFGRDCTSTGTDKVCACQSNGAFPGTVQPSEQPCQKDSTLQAMPERLYHKHVCDGDGEARLYFFSSKEHCEVTEWRKHITARPRDDAPKKCSSDTGSICGVAGKPTTTAEPSDPSEPSEPATRSDEGCAHLTDECRRMAHFTYGSDATEMTHEEIRARCVAWAAAPLSNRSREELPPPAAIPSVEYVNSVKRHT
jgi:hypothetical protein